MIGIHHNKESSAETTADSSEATTLAATDVSQTKSTMSPSPHLDDPLHHPAKADDAEEAAVATSPSLAKNRVASSTISAQEADQIDKEPSEDKNAPSDEDSENSLQEDCADPPSTGNSQEASSIQEPEAADNASTSELSPKEEIADAGSEAESPAKDDVQQDELGQQQQHRQPSSFSYSSTHPAQDATAAVVVKPRLKRPPLRPVDLGSTPKRSILKKESAYPFIEQPPRNPIFKSQWLQSTVSKLAVMSGPATPTAYTANSPSMFRKLVTQATAATAATPSTIPTASMNDRPQRPTGPPIFVNNERPLSFLESNGSAASLLSDKSMKRVRFSVGQLTTEHVFHHDDAYESAEESDQRSREVEITPRAPEPKKVMTTSEGVIVDDNIYTAKEIMHYYLVACNNREEFPVDRLVADMRAASSRPANPLLTTIDLSGEQLPRKTLDPISDVLTLEFGLKHLILDNCGLEDDTLKMLLYSLLLTDTLTVLSVQDNKKIKSTGFKYISVFVKKTKSLKSLNVSGIPMDKKSVEFLAHALRVGRLGFGSRLEELRMDQCGMRGNLLEIMAPAIRESNLRHVSMRSNRIGASGGVWLGVLMRDYDDQPNKAIPNNNEEQGFKRVFPGVANPELLKRTRGVEVLDVSDNDLRQGADFVAQTLRRNMSLKCLVLANNNLDPARLAVLADALKLNIGLQALDLSNNRVGGPVITGINALTQKLSFNKTLTKLSLSNTGLQSEGAIALAEFLPETRTLTQLDLTGNELVDIAGVMALSVSIRMNKSLTCLDMNVPPNDAEFARLSRDILRACIRNMEDKTGSNTGMPSADDMPTNTIFHQPSPTFIPEPSTPSVEDHRWLLLEGVAGELYRTRETLSAMEKALNHEKAMRRDWMEHLYRRGTAEAQVAASVASTEETGEDGQPPNPPPTTIVRSPQEQKMLDIVKGILYRGPPQVELYYHQCKRHQANILHLISRVDNERALIELENMSNLVNVFLQAYRALFALPEMPTGLVVGKRMNSLPPLTPVGQQQQEQQPSASESELLPETQTDLQESPALEKEQGAGPDLGQTQDQIVPEVLTEEPGSDLESSFLLEDEDDMDDELYTNDELIDVRRSSLLGENHRSSTSLDEPDTGERERSYHGRGLKPTPVTTTPSSSTIAPSDSERSPSLLASPLEMLRKAAEEEEGEILRRGKDLLENELGNEVAEESMTGEQLKIQILAGEGKT
ncbi:hypothetical protein BGZ68_000134 [Mortierella alpina]|nr:hypothetical protein BGZ68_000134 [Mortierella alpina]